MRNGGHINDIIHTNNYLFYDAYKLMTICSNKYIYLNLYIYPLNFTVENKIANDILPLQINTFFRVIVPATLFPFSAAFENTSFLSGMSPNTFHFLQISQLAVDKRT